MIVIKKGCSECGYMGLMLSGTLEECPCCGWSNEDEVDGLDDCYDEGDIETFTGIFAERTRENENGMEQIGLDLGVREERGWRE